MLEATERNPDKIAAAVRNPVRPLRGADRIGISVGKVIDWHRVAKYFRIEMEKAAFRYERDREAIAVEERLDGLSVMRASLHAADMGEARAVRTYNGLAVAERALGCPETEDPRVRRHALPCMLAHYLEWHMRRDRAPLLNGEDDLEESAAQARGRLASAKGMAGNGSTAEGLEMHGLRGLLGSLAELTRDTVRIGEGPAAVEQLSLSKPPQQRALQLFQVAPK